MSDIGLRVLNSYLNSTYLKIKVTPKWYLFCAIAIEIFY